MNISLAAALVILSLSSQAAMLGQTSSNQASSTAAPSAQVSLLKPGDVAKMLPSSVFFRGQSAPVQGRNSGGVRFEDKSVMLVSMVDSSGYSSSVQEKYQAYLITESALDIDAHRLPPGAYGCGFSSAQDFVVMDIGGHDLFTVHANRDAGLLRPTPLQVMAAPDNRRVYRLYVGRNFVEFRLAAGS